MDANIEERKQDQINSLENICCAYRGMKLEAERIAYEIRSVSILENLKEITKQDVTQVPNSLQAIEWELCEVVKTAASLLRDAGEALEELRNIRLGNETLIELEKQHAY